MSYDVIDVIDRLIKMNKKRIDIYSQECNDESPNINIVIKVLIKNIQREIVHFEELKEEHDLSELKQIDFLTYDKISFQLSEFNNKIKCEEINDVKELMKCSLELDEKFYALYLNIQGKLVRSIKDSETKTYKIISDIIKEKRNNIKEIKSII